MKSRTNQGLFSSSFKKLELKHPHWQQAGMTLLEIMIVLAILGSLAALLVTNLSSKAEKAKVQQTKIGMGNVINAIQQYYSDCGNYPEALDGLIESDGKCKNWGPDPYISKSKINDAWNNRFVYAVDGGNYSIKSLGKDKKEGGSGYDADISPEE